MDHWPAVATALIALTYITVTAMLNVCRPGSYRRKRAAGRGHTGLMQIPDEHDDLRDLVRQQVVDAYGPDILDSPEFSTGPGSYLAARAEADAEYEAFQDALPARFETAAREVERRMYAAGVLPEGMRFGWSADETPEQPQP